MRNYLEKLDKGALSILKDIGAEADALPMNAYVVGGLVRDILLKRKVLDLDVVVEGEAALLAQRYAHKRDGTLLLHERFGTATVSFKDGGHVDFVTAREEEYPTPGALPVVKSGFINDDLFRRDFTINAMAIRINRDRFGELVDEFGGMKDLKAKKIRILHEQSFKDDPTRILRAVRFEQRLLFKMEKKTENLLKAALKKDYAALVKPERYFAEFRKLLQEPTPKRYMERLAKLGGLKFLEMKNKIDFRHLALLEYNMESFSKRFFREIKDGWLVYLLGLVHAWPPTELDKLGGRFNLRRRDRTTLRSLPEIKKAFLALTKQGLKPSAVFKILQRFSDESIVYLRNFHSQKTVQKYIDDFLQKSKHVHLELNGRDLSGLGLPEGKRMKEVLDELLYKKLDGEFRTRQEEQQEAKKLIRLR